MSIFDGIEKLINEHGSAEILKHRLEFAKDQFEGLELKVESLRTENAELKAQLQREASDYKATREELEKFKKEHLEDVRVQGGVEFRRGKRTS
jgi:predicted RNase H-like nuclease (RuvC/YqgF family)